MIIIVKALLNASEADLVPVFGNPAEIIFILISGSPIKFFELYPDIFKKNPAKENFFAEFLTQIVYESCLFMKIMTRHNSFGVLNSDSQLVGESSFSGH